MMFLAAAGAIFVAIFLFLLRALPGPTIYDRILAVNALGTKTVIFVALLGFINGRPHFLDIALLYALMNFIATIAILKLVEYKHLG